jgi:ribonuclease Z
LISDSVGFSDLKNHINPDFPVEKTNIMKTSPTKVVLLGTGNPNPDPIHSGPSVVVIVNNTPYIFDFGPGLVRQAAAMTPRYGGKHIELDAQNLKKCFLTHLHSDHTIGLPDLLLTPWIMGRDEPLELYGPPGSQELADFILKAYRADIEYRLFGLEPINTHGWQVKVHEFKEGEIYSDDNLTVVAFLVRHGTLPYSFGFRISTPDNVIVISGDTAPCENIYKFSQDADILIHEVYYQDAFSRLDPTWQEYHSTHHTSTLELAELASVTQPGVLVVYHTLYWGGTNEDILLEIRRIYDGKIIVGADNLVIE